MADELARVDSQPIFLSIEETGETLINYYVSQFKKAFIDDDGTRKPVARLLGHLDGNLEIMPSFN